MVLNPQSADQPLLYGYLGNNITFLQVIAKYVPKDPMWSVETEQYIEYYFGDDPTKVRTMGQMLLLTGNSTKRIPQIYFNNPSTSNKVYLEILMANLSQDSLTNPDQFKSNSFFSRINIDSFIGKIVFNKRTIGSKTIVDTASVGIALYRGREEQRNKEKVLTL